MYLLDTGRTVLSKLGFSANRKGMTHMYGGDCRALVTIRMIRTRMTVTSAQVSPVPGPGPSIL